MHNLPSTNGVQNSSDPRSPLKRLRLHELKRVLSAEGIAFDHCQGTATQAVMLLDGVDLSKYIKPDAAGNLHFVAPPVKEEVEEEAEEVKSVKKKVAKK